MDTARLQAVADGAAQDAGGLDTALLGGFLPVVVDAAATGRRLRRRELAACTERGTAAALAGVPLRALVDLYLSACWRLWEELPAVLDGTAPQVRAAGLGVLRAADDGVAALAEGFQLARLDLVRRLEDDRREVVDALLAGGAPAAEALGRAADLGLDLASPHAVLVVRGEEPFTSGTGLEQRVERALAGRLGDVQPLVVAHAGQFVCVVAAPDPAALDEVTTAVTGVLGLERPDRWQAAVGRSLAGPGGPRASYDQARELLELAVRLRLRTPVLRASDLAVFQVLLRDRPAIDELISTLLGPLVAARGGPGPLLETLEAFYASGGRTTETARRLHLSVRAVTYRLERVATLLGRDPADPDQRFGMHAAVLAARLLDWPVVAQATLPVPGNAAAPTVPDADRDGGPVPRAG